MTGTFIVLIAITWLAGTWLRVYRQARFFQIEEYHTRRYLNWWLRKRDRTLPNRIITLTIIGVGLVAVFSEAPDSPLPGIIAFIATLAAVWPPDEGEIKKAFVRTQRATRILGAAFAVAIFDLATYLLLIYLTGIESDAFQIILVMAAGLLLYLTASLILVVGNLLMTPVEAFTRRQFINRAKGVMNAIQPTVIGITGSYGKTTTKTFLSHILNGRYHAYPTPKSFNTMMGVCRAINEDLTDNYSIEYFIVEMGAYVEGEIRRICDLTPPHIGIVVEIGPQHYERFGSIEHIVAAKYELVAALPPDGVAIFNWDNTHVREMYQRDYPATRIAVSKTVTPDEDIANGPRFIASDITETLQGLAFTVTDKQTGESESFTVPVLGEHNITNLLLATAAAVHEGMSLRDVAFRARTLQPAESRLTRTTSAEGITIINDAYSANPTGVIGALKALALHTTGKRLVITPGMVELGDLHEEENHKLGELLAQYATDVILVGSEQTAPVKAGLEAAGFPPDNLHVVEELRQAVSWYQEHLQSGDTVLFLNDLPDTY